MRAQQGLRILDRRQLAAADQLGRLGDAEKAKIAHFLPPATDDGRRNTSVLSSLQCRSLGSLPPARGEAMPRASCAQMLARRDWQTRSGGDAAQLILFMVPPIGLQS